MNTSQYHPSSLGLVAFVLAALAALLLLCVDPLDAGAAEPDKGKEVEGLLGTLKKAHKGDEDGVLPQALDSAVALHNGSEDPALRGKIQAALGALLKAKNAGSGRSAAASALAKLNDPAGAYKALKPAFPSAKRAEVAPYELRVVEAVGALVPPAAVADAAQLLKKGRARPAVVAAIQALGCYGQAGTVRVKVLGELLDAGAMWKAKADAAAKKLAKRKPPKEPKNPKKAPKEPRPKKGDVKAKQAVDDWQAYAPVLLESLNKLTGSTRPSVDDWLAIRQDKKAKLEDLFTTKS